MLVGELVEPDQLHLLLDHLVAIRLRDPADIESEGDVVAHRQPGHQGELLEHHRDAVAPQLAQPLRRARRDVDVVVAVADQHLAAGDRVEPIDAAQQRRLARAREAHHHQDLALVDEQRRVMHRHQVAGRLEHCVAAAAGVEQRQRPLRRRAEDHVDMVEAYGSHCGHEAPAPLFPAMRLFSLSPAWRPAGACAASSCDRGRWRR